MNNGEVAKLMDGQNRVVVNADGKVVRDNSATNDTFALIADVYSLKGELRHIVDLRFDLTHLDDKVKSNT